MPTIAPRLAPARPPCSSLCRRSACSRLLRPLRPLTGRAAVHSPLARLAAQRSRMDAGRLKLESIKAEKLATLQKAGVPDKYTVDLANKKFT